MKKKIEKPWAVYHGVNFFVMNIGLITKETESGSLVIQYSEGQLYPEEYWDSSYVRRFDTPEEAVSYYAPRKERVFDRERKRIYENFPKAIRKQKLEKLCALLTKRKEFLLAQRLP